MHYVSVPEINRETYAAMVGSQDASTVASALLSIAYWEKDWHWAQEQLLQFVDHTDSHVREIAVQGFGHVVRFNLRLDTDKVEPVLKRIANDDTSQQVRGTAEDTLEDLEIYIHRPRKTGHHIEPAGRLT